MKKILLILLVLLSTLGFSQNPNWSGYTNDYGSHKFKFYSTRAHYTSLDTVWTPTSQKTGDIWWDNSNKTLSIQTSNTLVRKLITDDSISYYIKQPTATSVDNSLLKTVGTSGRAVEQTGVTVSDGNIVSAPTFSATNLTDGYVPYHISDALGQGNSVIYNDAVNDRIGISTNEPLGKIHIKLVPGETGLQFTCSSGHEIYFYGNANVYSTGLMYWLSGSDMHFGSEGVNSQVVLKSGNLGIGTTTPTAALHLKAGTTVASTAPLKFTSGTLLIAPEAGAVEFLTDRWYGTITTETARKQFAFLEDNLTSFSSGTATSGHVPTANGSGGITWAAAAGSGSKWTQGTYGIHYASGNVGIGCTSPTSKLSVLGTTATNNNLFNLVHDANKVRTTFADATDTSSIHASFTSTGSPEFHIVGKTGNELFKVDSSIVSAPTFSSTNLTDGYIPYHISDALGQGNTTMSYNAVNNEIKLTGNQVLTNTTNASKFGIIYKGITPFIHNFNYGNNGTVTTDGNNTFIGINAGNFTMGSNATQTYHSSNNVFTGNQAGQFNTTGYNNVFTGFAAGRSNTTGFGNVFTGYSAGQSNTTGYYNVFTGYRAGYTNTTGYNNVFTGNQAGRYLADGVTTNNTSNTSVFIGNDTRALSAGNNNQIVIGASATGKGSNTVVLGNNSIVGTYLQGNVGVSCNSPTSKLSVLGTTSTNNNLFNFVNGDINKLRTTFTTATDSSSIHASSTSTGSIEFHIVGKGGSTQFKSDSVSTTFLGTYAGIYVADASTAQAIATGTTYTKSTAFTTNGSSSNCTADAANDKITITKTGHYLVNCPVSFSGESPNVNWKMAAFLGGVEQPQVHVQRKIGTGGDVGSTTCTGIINVTSVPVDLDIRFRHDQAGNENITVVYSNLTVTYIGE